MCKKMVNKNKWIKQITSNKIIIFLRHIYSTVLQIIYKKLHYKSYSANNKFYKYNFFIMRMKF